MAHRETFWPMLEPQIDWICRQLRRLGVPERDVPDLAQDVLVELYKTWATYDDERSLRAWIFGFVFRIASAYRRRADNRLVAVFEDPPLPPDIRSALTQIEERQELELVHEALMSIPEPRRAVFIMARIEEISIVDAAEALGINLNTAYGRLRTANEEFADAVKRLRIRRREAS